MRNVYSKKIRLALVVGFMLSGMSNFAVAQVGQSGWTFVNPKPIGFWILSTSFIDNNNGLAVGQGGGIAKTTDGGTTWQTGAFYYINGTALAKPALEEVQMVTPTVAYAIGNQPNGILLKSIDGGLNWSLVPNPFSIANRVVNSMSWLNENVGYLVGDTITGIRGTALYKTTNGGSTWTVEPNLPVAPPVRLGTAGNATNPLRYDSSRGKTLNVVRFVREDLGYVGGQTGLVWKYDGTGWKDYSITNLGLGLDTTNSCCRPIINGPQSQIIKVLGIMDDTLVVAASLNNSAIVRISTSGDTAKSQLTNFGSTGFGNVFGTHRNIIKTNEGRLILSGGRSFNYFYSSDSGKTWQASPVYPNQAPFDWYGFDAVAYTPEGRVIFGGEFGTVADSLNGTWRRNATNKFHGVGFTKIRFADNNNAAISGGRGALAITKDGGTSWEDKSNLNDRAGFISYTAMSYPSINALYIATNTGVVRGSYDQGETFDQLFVDSFVTQAGGSNPPLNAMFWLNDQQGWVSSYRGHNSTTRQAAMFFTKDGGLTWDSVKNFPTGVNTPDFKDILFANERVGYAASNRSSIWKTMDGGLNWTQVLQTADYAGFTGTFLRLSMLDSNVVWAVGGNSKIYRTLDGGANWEDARGDFPLNSTEITSVINYDSSQAFITMANGMIWFTRNGGGSWTAYAEGVQTAYRDYQEVFQLVGSGTLTDLAFAAITPGCGQEVCNTLWTVGLGGYIMRFGSDKVLPVKYFTLSGSSVNGGNQLFWNAFEQAGVEYFVVEGSADGRKYETLEKRVYGTGLASSTYSWFHKDARNGKFFYRVKAVEKSGNVYYTNVYVVDNKFVTGWKYQIAGNALVLTNVQALRGDVTVQVVNTSGQVVAAKNWKQSGGAFNDLLYLPNSAHGVYFIRVINEGNTQTFRVLVP